MPEPSSGMQRTGADGHAGAVEPMSDYADALVGHLEPVVHGQQEGLRSVALRGGLWAAASQLLPAGGTVVLSVAAGRYLGSGPLGQQSMLAYVNGALAAVLIIALNSAVLQIGGRLQGQGDFTRLRELLRWAIGAHLAAGFVVFAMMAALGGVLKQNWVSWVILGVVSVLDAVTDAFALRLILVEGWAPIGRLRLAFQLIGPPLGLVFMLAGYGIAGIFVGAGLAALGLTAAAAVRYQRVGPIAVDPAHALTPAGRLPTAAQPIRPRRPAVWRSYSLFAVSAVITQIVTLRVEFVILAIFATDSAIAQYSVAFMVVSLIAMIPVGVAVAAMPLVARAHGAGNIDHAERHLRLALRLGTAISIPVAALVAALGPPAVIAVYGVRWETAARLVPVSSLGLLVAVIGGVCTQYWSGLGQLKIVLWTGAIAGVADVGLACALVPSLSSFGAVLANLAGHLVLAGGLLFATVRRSGAIGWRIDGLLRMALAGGLGAAAVVLVRIAADRLSLSPEPRAVIALAVGAMVGVGVVLLAALVLRPLDREEADWLRSLLPRQLHPLAGRLSSAVAGAP